MNKTIVKRDVEICHYGVKGMRWGVRRFQNSDGSLTAKGRARQASNSKHGKQVKDAISNINFNKRVKSITPEQINIGKKEVMKALKTIGVVGSVAISGTYLAVVGYNVAKYLINDPQKLF